ncbi:MAG: c-type cytochrome [Vicinamibacteria bacterium]
MDSMAGKFWVFSAVLVLGAFVACESGEAPSGDPEPASPPAAAMSGVSVERGEYLANHVMLCFACHGEIDYDSPELSVVPGTEGSGGPFPDEIIPYPINVPNITPDEETGAGTWTDEQIKRALRHGIGHDDRVLFVGMPWPFFRVITDDDLDSLVAYLRSIPPVRKEVPPTPAPPPFQEMLRPLTNAPLPPAPDMSDPVQRGQYLVHMGLCRECHTPIDAKGEALPGMDFAGGRPLFGRWGRVFSANLTQDASGIPHYTEEVFLQVMHTGNPGGRQLNPIMLWGYFKGMTDEDLKAIYAYLRTLKPVRHNVDNLTPPTYCKLCQQDHGLGDRN